MEFSEVIVYGARVTSVTVRQLEDGGNKDLFTYKFENNLEVGHHPECTAAMKAGDVLKQCEADYLSRETREDDRRETREDDRRKTRGDDLTYYNEVYRDRLISLLEKTRGAIQGLNCNQESIIRIQESGRIDLARYYSINPLLSPALAHLGCPRRRYVVPDGNQREDNQEIKTMLVVDSRYNNQDNRVVEQLARQLRLSRLNFTIVRWDNLEQVNPRGRYDIVIIIGDILPPEHEGNFYNIIIQGSGIWQPKLALLLHPSMACRSTCENHPLGAAQAFIMNGARHCFAFRGHTPIDGAQHFLQGILKYLAIDGPCNLPTLEEALNHAINRIYGNLEQLSPQGTIAALSTIQLSGEVVRNARD